MINKLETKWCIEKANDTSLSPIVFSEVVNDAKEATLHNKRCH
jgi:hypothetical protein